MLRDRREEILARIYDIARDTPGIEAVYRNVNTPPEELRPALVLKDGDEIASPIDEKFRSLGVNICVMSPRMVIFAAGDDVTMPSQLSLLRSALTHGIIRDEILDDITGENGSIRYVGCTTTDEWGNQLIGEMRLEFAITYPFLVKEMTP